MQQLKAQQNKFNELKKQQERIDSNTERLKEQMNKNSNNNNNNNNSPKNIQSILNRIRAQNAVDNADNVLNETSDDSDRVSIESTLGKEEIINNTTDENDSAKGETLTLGSDGKPKTRKRKGKPTISIST